MFIRKRIDSWFAWRKTQNASPLIAGQDRGRTTTDRIEIGERTAVVNLGGSNARPSWNESARRAGAGTVAEPRERSPRGTRRLRRTQSPVGLPLYSEDPTDDEMTLVKRQPLGTELDVIESDAPDLENMDPVISYGYQTTDSRAGTRYAETNDIRGRTRSRESSETRFVETSQPSPEIVPLDSEPNLRPFPTTLPTGFSTSMDSPPCLSDNANHLFQSRSRTSTSSPGLSEPSESSPSNSPLNQRRRSTLRSIFARNGSFSFLPDANDNRNPYGQDRSGGSTTRLASASNASISSMNISSPLPHTLVTTSFVLPRAGATPSQMSFISSRESLGAFGHGPGAEPPSFATANTPSPTSSRNSFSSQYGERPAALLSPSSAVDIIGRGRRSASISTQYSASPMASSPLANRLDLSAPADEYPEGIVDDTTVRLGPAFVFEQGGREIHTPTLTPTLS